MYKEMFRVGDTVIYKDNPVERRVRDINAEGELLLWGFGAYVDAYNLKKVFKVYSTDSERIKKAKEIEKELIKILEVFELKGRIVIVKAGKESYGYSINIKYPNDINEFGKRLNFERLYKRGNIEVAAALDYRDYVKEAEDAKWQ